ncbi:RNA polymerase sigma-70 factor [Pedobacter riviphilus]|uniref:RNA polymerase sigma-70 factor n=1 Tax=Pedobacter riviphilus TaxID=2766984 RepID=A0ABX6TIK5_9SPHI|nr:RNA polymerase sigma-70 factor [Pedobacter riviphilus]QNR85142.1 RNA polymerase sigma-70 factor [Pedobacter riviphilus]
MSIYQISGQDELISRLRDGDELAFSEIYNLYWKQLYRTAFTILRDEEGASDALQEMFLHLWRRRKELNIVSLKAYLHQSVRLTVLKAIRSQKVDAGFYKRLAEITTEIIEEDPMIFKDHLHLLQRLIDSLPADCRQIFLMSREEQMSYKQIAGKLEISVKTVEKKMSKSLKLIREGLSIEMCVCIIVSYTFI